MASMIRRALLAATLFVVLLSGCDLGTVVRVVEVANLELDPEAQPIQTGNTLQLDARPSSARGEQLSPTRLTFSSSNAEIATVSSSGLVTATGPGTAILTASADGVSATSTIHSVPLFCLVSGTLLPGESVSGQIEPGSCTLSNIQQGSRHNDFWFLEMTSEAGVQITLSSGQFDTLLALHVWNGTQALEFNNAYSFIDVNDDFESPNSTDSRLTLTLSPGIYLIVGTTSIFGQTGSYQLSIS